MATCKDCLHVNVCIHRIPSEDETICRQFINKNDVVHVVYCGECNVPHNKWTGCPNLNGLIPPPNFYCAKGRRKGET